MTTNQNQELREPGLNYERRAEHLQDLLHSFAAMETADREAQIGEVLASVHALAEQDTLPSQPGFQEAFDTAIHDALDTSFGLPSGEVINPWKGAYTIVAVSTTGDVLGKATDTHDEVYDMYGTNLYPYALSKAIIRLHLELAGRSGGLDNDENYEYIAGLLPDDMMLFKGEATVPDIGGKNNYPGIILGASGCPLKADYKETIAPGMSGKSPEDHVNFLAGSADEEFAETVAIHLARPGIPLSSVREHRDYSRLRRAH